MVMSLGLSQKKTGLGCDIEDI